MLIKDLIHFRDDIFFEGAVQLCWYQKKISLFKLAAENFVFHGPRFHSADDIEPEHVLKDPITLLLSLLSHFTDDEVEESNPFTLTIAGYGSGKSHFALTSALLFGKRNSSSKKKILKNIRDVYEGGANAIDDQLSKLKKSLFVIAIDGMANFNLGQEFVTIVLRQLEIDNIDADHIHALSPRFETAVEFVKRNYENKKNEFRNELPRLSKNSICKKLQERNDSTFESVDNVYLEANGSRIPVQGSQSPQNVLTVLCEKYCGDDGHYAGVVILFDELGRYLEYAAESPNLAGAAALQQMFQGVQDNKERTKFMGFLQYDLRTYLKRFNTEDLQHIKRFTTRFDIAEKLFFSTNLETIFTSLIAKDNLDELQKIIDEHSGLTYWTEQLPLLHTAFPTMKNIDTWNNVDKFYRTIIEGCWPLHPLTTWFLTKQQDIVQQRSALTFVRDIISSIKNKKCIVNNQIKFISVAELVLDSMLSELIAAEEIRGSNTAEILQMLLEKYKAKINRQSKLLLTGVMLLEKFNISRIDREMVDNLLLHITGLSNSAFLEAMKRVVDELGAIEWNDDIYQYELISDAASRAQFKQELRRMQKQLSSDQISDIFQVWAKSQRNLDEIRTNFDQIKHISTKDWIFAATLMDKSNFHNQIERAFKQWRGAIKPDEPKGQVLYLFIEEDADPKDVRKEITKILQSEMQKYKLQAAPLLVIILHYTDNKISEYLKTLYVLDEIFSEEMTAKYNRFIFKEHEQALNSFKELVNEGLLNRDFLTATTEEIPKERFSTICRNIFEKIYTKTIPFPFDGFGSGAGNGPADCATITKTIILRQLNGNWIATQQRRIQNRATNVLVNSWKVLDKNGNISIDSKNGEVAALFKKFEKAHKDDPKRSLGESFRELIAPPYGLNSASAGLFLGIILGTDNPPRNIQLDDNPTTFKDWLKEIYPSGADKYYFNLDVLDRTYIHYLSMDAFGRWRNIFHELRAETIYQDIETAWLKIEEERKTDPFPESLQPSYELCESLGRDAISKMGNYRSHTNRWEQILDDISDHFSMKVSLEIGCELSNFRAEITNHPYCWSKTQKSKIVDCIKYLKEEIKPKIDPWMNTNVCKSPADVVVFSQGLSDAAKSLQLIGLSRESKNLLEYRDQEIKKATQREKYELLIQHAESYIKSVSTTSTRVCELKSQISIGDTQLKALKESKEGLGEAYANQLIIEISDRQAHFKELMNTHLATLRQVETEIPSVLDDLSKSRDITKSLCDIFDGSGENETLVRKLWSQIDYIYRDLTPWDQVDVTPESLERMIDKKLQQKIAKTKEYIMKENIKSTWHLDKVYTTITNNLVERIRKKSEEWMESNFPSKIEVKSLNTKGCKEIYKLIDDMPAYLDQTAREKLQSVANKIENRLNEIQEIEQHEKEMTWLDELEEKTREVSNLSKGECIAILRTVEKPSDQLSPQGLTKADQISRSLQCRLDELDFDSILNRIEELTEDRKKELFDLLSNRYKF